MFLEVFVEGGSDIPVIREVLHVDSFFTNIGISKYTLTKGKENSLIPYFEIVVVEIESWFIADSEAVKSAYPSCNTSKIESITPDAVIGAWEILAESIGKKPINCSGADKIEWARNISPHLDLTNPHSPSLITFIEGIDKVLTKRLGSKT